MKPLLHPLKLLATTTIIASVNT